MESRRSRESRRAYCTADSSVAFAVLLLNPHANGLAVPLDLLEPFPAFRMHDRGRRRGRDRAATGHDRSTPRWQLRESCRHGLIGTHRNFARSRSAAAPARPAGKGRADRGRCGKRHRFTAWIDVRTGPRAGDARPSDGSGARTRRRNGETVSCDNGHFAGGHRCEAPSSSTVSVTVNSPVAAKA